MRLTAIILLLSTLVGCSTASLLSNPKTRIGITEERLTAHTKVIEGKTTKQEARQLYGSPSESFSSNSGTESDRWHFYNLGWPYDSETFFVIINYESGVVKSIETQLSK